MIPYLLKMQGTLPHESFQPREELRLVLNSPYGLPNWIAGIAMARILNVC